MLGGQITEISVPVPRSFACLRECIWRKDLIRRAEGFQQTLVKRDMFTWKECIWGELRGKSCPKINLTLIELLLLIPNLGIHCAGCFTNVE